MVQRNSSKVMGCMVSCRAPAGKWEAAPSGGDAQLASRAADAPAGAREEPERVERVLAQLDLVEQDERGLLGQSDALVVCHAGHYCVDVACGAAEQGRNQVEVGLEVELDEPVAGKAASDLLCGVRLAGAPCTSDEERPRILTLPPAFDCLLEPSAHGDSKIVYLRYTKFRKIMYSEYTKFAATGYCHGKTCASL